MKDSHTAQRTTPLVGWALIGAALESLYLLLYALAPIATVYPHVFPLGQVWPWTLALARLLFPGALAGNGSIPDAGPYFLLLGITFTVLGCVYLYMVISASRTGAIDRSPTAPIRPAIQPGDVNAINQVPTAERISGADAIHQVPTAGRINHVDAIHRVPTAHWLLLPLIGAALFGITLLFLPAIFSTDIITYISASHMPNIYYGPPFSTLVPQIPPMPNYGGILTDFRPVLYGPLWLGIASLLTRMSRDLVTVVLLFRGLALVVHLINCMLVWTILSKIAPANRLLGTLLYAWNPLILIELVVNGHNEGVIICLLLLALWFYVQQRSKWFDIATLLCCGLAISINLMVLLITPLLLWFMVRNERHITRAILSFSWRALFVLAIVCIAYAPVWQGGATFLAITSSIDLQNFMYSLLALLVMPLRALYSQLTGGINLPSSLLQPLSAADTTILASTLFIFALLYFQALGRVQSPWGGGGGPYNVLFTCWTIVIIGFVALASTLFWPWYIIWVVWIVALRRFDALTIAVLLLSCTALLYYPFLRLDTTPAGIYVPLGIFGVPFVYLIAQRYLPLRRISRSHSKGGSGANVEVQDS
ncbi:MAG: hypothetical protein E6I32_15150 [Chloroflexi bacterium]|nr:MAG: hypothetical protein E6I32_15150 [Chloroflexota bacterium]